MKEALASTSPKLLWLLACKRRCFGTRSLKLLHPDLGIRSSSHKSNRCPSVRVEKSNPKTLASGLSCATILVEPALQKMSR